MHQFDNSRSLSVRQHRHLTVFRNRQFNQTRVIAVRQASQADNAPNLS
jgi:cell envelope opacity-associated protein A